MKKFQIAIDFTPFVYARAPGYNEYAMSLIEGLLLTEAEKFRITLFVRLDQKNIFEKYEKSFNVKYVDLKSVYVRVIWQNLIFPFYEFDLFVFTGNFAPILNFRKYVVVIHDLNYLRFPSNFNFLALFYRRFVTSRSIIRSTACIAISGLVANDIKKSFNKEAAVIYNPVCVENFEKSIELFSNVTSKSIVCASSLAQHKNIPAAYEAALRIVAEYPDVSFVFIGNWHPSSFLDYEKSSKIKILGYVSNEEKSMLFNSASAILAPSKFEGFGMPYVEAMMLNKCLVCSDIPISKEICGDYPVFIEKPHGADDIYFSLKKAINSDFSVGAIIDLTKYAPVSVAKSYLKLLGEILENKHVKY